MKDELQQIDEILTRLTDLKVPALFIAFDGDQFVTVKNCPEKTIAGLLINQIESTDEMKEAFTQELEEITRRELESFSTE